MFKVLIVDDEVYVVSLIERLIDWEALDMCVAGTAENGARALELAREEQPDIMIVDMQMPGLDGISLMQKVREIDSHVKFIIISGHKRFEYARSAMKYNVEDYLLKPISGEELTAILTRMRDRLEREQADRQAVEAMDSQLGISRERVHRQLLDVLLFGEAEANPRDEEEANGTYLTGFRPGRYAVVILKVDSSEKELDRSFLRDLLGRLAELFREELSPDCHELLYRIDRYRLTVLLNLPPEQWERLPDRITGAQDRMAEHLARFEKIKVSTAVGPPVEALSGVRESFREASRGVDARISLGSGRVLLSWQIPRDDGALPVVLSDKELQTLMDGIRTFDIRRIRELVVRLFERAGEYAAADPTIHIALTGEVYRLFYEYINRIDICRESEETLRMQLFESLEGCMHPSEVAEALVGRIAAFIEKYAADSEAGVNPAIRIARRYIMENYARDISLSSMAGIVNLSPVYFSMLFKKEVGVNFVDYLNRYRIDNARRLLREVRYNVNEVSVLCGFGNTRYFSKMFKKIVGITPTEYRQRQIGR